LGHIKPGINGLGNRCSIRLSYGTILLKDIYFSPTNLGDSFAVLPVLLPKPTNPRFLRAL
jgi:hypothetical protein